MANAKKCDRCGTFYTNCKPINIHLVTDPRYDNGEKQLSLTISRTYGDIPVDLCPECVDKLIRYFNDGWEEQK